jgi:predicted nucleotidyltransferase
VFRRYLIWVGKKCWLTHYPLFGSKARGEASAADVDLLASLDDTRKLSLLDVIHIENQIADLLGEPVDLIVDGTLREHMKENVDREAVRAF